MHRTEYGFIAQEVEQVLKDQGIQNSGMLTIDDKGFYELRYNDLFAPVVKAIQELKSENDALKGENASMKKELSSLRVTVSEQIKEMRSMVLKIARSNATEGNVSSIGGSR
jgi:predicted RNase H-like nuclease (RuvC/YqgF family)